LWILRRSLSSPPQSLNSKKGNAFISFVFFAALLVSVAIFFLRFLVAGRSQWTLATWYKPFEPIILDPGNSFTMQGFVSFYYMVPILLAAAYSLACGASPKNKILVRDLTALCVGGMAETNFALVVAAYHHLTKAEFQSSDWNCLAINIALLAVTHLFLLYSWTYDVFDGFLPHFLRF
jgi:hypothetical protein